MEKEFLILFGEMKHLRMGYSMDACTYGFSLPFIVAFKLLPDIALFKGT